MAVGKGSVERAAKVKAAEKKTAEKKTETAKAVKTPETVTAADIVASPDEQVLGQIVYQSSSGMLERDAEPNEIFGLGDAMPVYYF